MRVSLPAWCTYLKVACFYFTTLTNRAKAIPGLNKNSLAMHGLVCALLFLPGSILAQPAIQWDKIVSSEDLQYYEFNTVKQTLDDGYIAGASLNDQDGHSIMVFKLSATGTKQWEKSFVAQYTEELAEIIPTPDGGYLLAGTSRSNAAGDKSENDRAINGGYYGDYWIIKIAADGSKLWDRTIGGTGSDMLREAKSTADGGFILVGLSDSGVGADKSESNLNGRVWLVKVNAEGIIEWDKTTGSQNPKEGEGDFTMDVTQDGGYVIASSYWRSIPGDTEHLTEVIKVATDGTTEWSKVLEYTLDQIPTAIRQTPEGDYVLTLRTYASRKSFILLKLDHTGNPIWYKTYRGRGFAITDAYALSLTSDNGYLIAGRSSANKGKEKSEDARNSEDYWIVKVDRDGIRHWDKTIGGTGKDALASMQQTRDGGYILGGVSLSPVGVDKSEPVDFYEGDIWLVKLAPEPARKRLSFTPGTIRFSAVAGSVGATQPATLIAGSGSPEPTLTKSLNSSWLTLPEPGLGALHFGVDATGLTPGSYTDTVTAAAAGYRSATLVVELTVTDANQLTTVRINAGGERSITSDGRVFTADQYYTGTDRVNAIASQNIKYTSEDVLYRSERSAASFGYNIPVVNGEYVVVLHFAEIWFGIPGGRHAGPGQRLFHVDIEASRKLTDYDIFTKAQGALTAVEEEFRVTVSDGQLNIDFSSGAANLPTVAAIEVIPRSEYTRRTVVISPVEDAYIQEYSYENFGTSPLLIVKDTEDNPNILGRRSYLKFPSMEASQVTSAKLRVYGYNAENTSGVKLYAYGVDQDNWSETQINGNTAPAFRYVQISGVSVNNEAKYYELDVTSFVQELVANDPFVSFGLSSWYIGSTVRNIRLDFHSRENPSGNAPQLVITTNAAARPSLQTTRIASEEITSEDRQAAKSAVYPNPVRKQFTLSLSPKHEGPVSMQMISQSGRSYPVKALGQSTASAQKHIDLSGLTLEKGIYLLKISSKFETEVLKVLIAE
ncbi:CBM96 family carbohydrate-binding protein [Dyadobacter sediminis]|uniref:DNRLRE domain-containing protein n=1 Tax=Dyadobacter sediminis TaxID=1493691 RepID=A0A5R9K893_9BACT|nr:malectin domain-containing carbohydrate-binding protein [Dyadobacter sediminis]TLU90306.1 DNRLRE domain-containing protein [Dyadobacter sediminis]GGC06727.1 hypothetical protein GCM10011325_36940 [Dyadobacter sediminis]